MENRELKHFARKCMAYCESLAVNNKKLNQKLSAEVETRKRERESVKRMNNRVPPLWQMEGNQGAKREPGEMKVEPYEDFPGELLTHVSQIYPSLVFVYFEDHIEVNSIVM